MIRIFRYVTVAVLPWLFLGVLAVVMLFAFTQAFRMAPLFAGAAVPAGQLRSFLWSLLLPVLSFAIAPAFVVAVLSAAGGMAQKGELEAFEAVGISRVRLALAPAVMALALSVLLGHLWLFEVPAMGRNLRAQAENIAIAAVVARLEPGQVDSPVEGLTFHADRKIGSGHFSGVFVALDRKSDAVLQVVARDLRVEMSPSPLTAHLAFTDGHLLHAGPTGMQMTMSFNTLSVREPLLEGVEASFLLLPPFQDRSTAELLASSPDRPRERFWRYELTRRFSRPATFAVLSACAIWLAFFVRWGSRGAAVAVAAALYLVSLAADRFFEALLNRDVIGPFQAAFGAPVLLMLLFAVIVSLRKKRNKPLFASTL